MVAVFLLLVFLIWIAGRAGFPLADGNPLPEEIRSWAENQPESVLRGQAASIKKTESSVIILLDHSCLINNSYEYPVSKVQITLPGEAPEDLKPGAVLVVSGKLEPFSAARNPGEFDRRRYMACRHCYYQVRNAVLLQVGKNRNPLRAFLYSAKEKFRETLEKSAGEDAAEFLAIALGEKSAMETGDRMLYQMAGILHIFVISGLHVSIIGTGLYELLLRRAGLGIPASGIAASVVLLLYGIMTGGTASAMRSAAMFLVLTGARILGRIYDVPSALALSGILLLAESPGYICDAGFLLSFSAAAGTAYLYPCLCTAAETAGLMKRKNQKLLRSVLLSTAVQLTTIPVLLYTYGEISLTGTVLNLLILPTSGIALVSAVAAMLAGSLFLPAGILAALPGRIVLKVYHRLAEGTGLLPVRTWIAGSPGALQTAGYILILVLLVFEGEYLKRRKRLRKELTRGKRGMHLLATASMAILLIPLIGFHPFAGIRITVLDIGQGSCTVVQADAHRAILLDGGSTSKEKIGQYTILPFLKNQGIRELDAVFVSHTDQDHISGIQELLELQKMHVSSLRIHALVLPDWEMAPQTWQELARAAEEAGVLVCRAGTGMEFRDGKVQIRVLAPDPGTRPDDVNEDGLVAQLKFGRFSMLFPGDIGEKTETELLSRFERNTVLLAPHHGSGYSGSREFVNRVEPQTAVISCSENNRYGHPAPEAVERLKETGAEIFFTMKSGAVTIVSDGEKYGAAGYLDE